jgi:hypothetical protein
MYWCPALRDEWVALITLGRGVLVLAPHWERASVFHTEVLEQINPTLVRRTTKNYIGLRNRGWILFHPVAELLASDNVGHPHVAYWPAEDLDYLQLPYEEWRKQRPGNVWRPLESVPEEEVPGEPLTMWQHLLKDDD